MKFPFFAITILLTIFCVMLLLKSFDYGQGWAIALAAIGVLLFAILSIISITYQIRLGEEDQEVAHH